MIKDDTESLFALNSLEIPSLVEYEPGAPEQLSRSAT